MKTHTALYPGDVEIKTSAGSWTRAVIDKIHIKDMRVEVRYRKSRAVEKSKQMSMVSPNLAEKGTHLKYQKEDVVDIHPKLLAQSSL